MQANRQLTYEDTTMGRLHIISTDSEPFSSRAEAGRLLAEQLEQFRGKETVVCGIPRGGVVIARQLAETLDVPMDIVLSHKLGAPGNPELAIGAVCEDGKLFVDEVISSYVGANNSYIENEKTNQLSQMSARVHRCREILEKVPLEGRTVIVTDDGIATGATMQAAIWAVRQDRADRVIVAVPVGPADSIKKLAEDADEIVCLKMPPYFGAIGRFYLEFTQVDDDELMEILKSQSKRRGKE
ncbi:MAG TPA: phosphoribosyltransferase [Phycisphaerales bacterium]|nr:phosphoribosyltransferase [Phycisphaerales bacterium]